MLKLVRFAPIVAVAISSSAFATVVVNFESPTYSAGQDINSGQDGWIKFGLPEGVVTPDVISGYVPPAYPILEGSQSFAYHGGNPSGYTRGWGAASSQVGDSAVLSWLWRSEVDAATGVSNGFYLSDNVSAGTTPAGIEFDYVADKLALFGAGPAYSQLTTYSILPATTYKLEMELDFTTDQYVAYATDLTNAGPKTLLGIRAFAADLTAATTAASGGIAMLKGAGTAYFIDDVRLVLPTPGWKNNASGDWNLAGNWVGGIPNGTDKSAAFGDVITSAQTVYTNTPVTVGTMTFDNANTYVIAGAGSLTIDAGASTALVSVAQGSHQINLKTIFASDTNINVASGATLTLGNPVTIKAGKVVAKTGNILIEAPLTVEANAALSLNAGSAVVFGAPSLASGAKIDVKSNALTIDYRGQVTPAATVKGQLSAGYNNGAWNTAGINTSSATATKGLGWKDNAGSESIQIKYTYYGDTDLSGTVASTDFNALVAAYGKSSGAIWSEGDFNYDGKVNTLDFNQLAGNFGAPAIPGAALGSVVPEPGTSCLLLGVALMLAKRRRSIHL